MANKNRHALGKRQLTGMGCGTAAKDLRRADENTHRFIYFLTDTPTESTCVIK